MLRRLRHPPRAAHDALSSPPRPIPRLGALLLIAVAFATSPSPAFASAPDRLRRGHPHAQATLCTVPALTGLTVAAARRRTARSGCRLRLRGARVERAEVQTIRRQTPRPGRRRHVVSAWVNPLCPGSAALGPPNGEPFVSPGPTGLVSGLYLSGGPLLMRSAPLCTSLSGTPTAGTITVSDPTSGAVIATRTVESGQLARIPLPAGTYTLVGTFADAYSNNQHISSRPLTVSIPPGRTVRQDVVANIK